MLRLINLALLFSLVVFASVIYSVKYDARGVDHDLGRLAADIEKERETIAVLRAEWSLLNNPQRIERLARAHLSFDTVKAAQFISMEKLDAAMAQTELQAKAGDPGVTASITPSR
jgi:cell division protein FtsL